MAEKEQQVHRVVPANQHPRSDEESANLQMAEKEQQVHPLAPANKHPRSDEESANLQMAEKEQQVHPLAPANKHPRSDEESANLQMDEKEQQVHPLALANDHPRSDEESAYLKSKDELKRKKRIKYVGYIAAFAVFQTAVILVFALIVMRAKNPKVRIGRATIETMETNNNGSAASFDLKFITQVRVKNTNFGHYRFENSTMRFLYDGVIVGEAIIPKGRARARSTKKFDVTVEVNSRALTSTTGLGSELSYSVLTLNSQAKLKGKVELMKVMKRKKSPEMNCTLTFNVSIRNLQDLMCK
ncbi:hypothetical protein REPUB_Repub08aG0174500 [Reevesia pubescens]